MFPLGRVRRQGAEGLWLAVLDFRRRLHGGLLYFIHVENLRVGFACEGECEGGGWHGKGGYVDVDDPSVWAQLLVAFAALSVVGILAHACYRYAKIRRRTKRFYAAQAAAAAPMPPAPASPKPTVGEGDIESVAL